MKKLFLALLLLASSAYADPISVAWDAVTLDTAGNPVTITGYKLYESSVAGTYTTAIGTIAQPATNYSFTENRPGKWYLVVTAYNDAGESGKSNEINFTVSLKAPAAPKNLKATVTP